MACWQGITQAGVKASLGYSTTSSETLPEDAKTLAKGKHTTIKQEEEEIVKKKKGNDKGKWKGNPCFNKSLKNSSKTSSRQMAE